jgi:hypothetical protein
MMFWNTVFPRAMYYGESFARGRARRRTTTLAGM